MEFSKAYCLTRASYHEKEAENAKRDAETVASDPDHRLKTHHYDMFTKLYEDHTRYAEAWSQEAEKME